MKQLLTLLLSCLIICSTIAQQNKNKPASPDPSKKILTVEASCGKCQLGLPGKSCDLAIRLDGKAYYVDGANIDAYGDAHARDGFCNSIRKAEVQGVIKKNRFKATWFKLLPEETKDADQHH